MNALKNISSYFKDSIAQTHMFSDLKIFFQEFECKINRGSSIINLKRRTDYGEKPFNS